MSHSFDTGHVPNFHITQSNFELLIGPGFWELNEIPYDRLAQIGGHFHNRFDTLGVYASGYAPRPLDNPTQPVAGIDWLRIETNPTRNEPPINVCHYVIGKPNKNGYPVWVLKDGALAPHWSTLQDLEIYF